jgi:putative chitinase
MVGFFSVKNIEEIDFAKLVRQLPNRPSGWNPFSTQGKYIRAILESYPVLLEYEINTPQRLAHFLGQGLVETNYLQAKAEDLTYSFATLKRLFGRKFANDDEIRAYAGKPEKIANRIYANRMWNGPEESGDGYRYRGRGFFQITGKENYTKFSEIAGVDLVGDPEALERDLKLSVRVAAAYFKSAGLGEYADRDDVSAVSRGINRPEGPTSPTPANHEADRIDWTRRAQALVRDPKALLKTELDPSAPLAIGATGEAVRALQGWLDALGYAVGAADGIFGPATRRAVLAFQDEHALPATGIADEATRAAIQRALDLPAPETPAPAPPAPEQPAVPTQDAAPPPGESPSDATLPAPEPAPVAPAPVAPSEAIEAAPLETSAPEVAPEPTPIPEADAAPQPEASVPTDAPPEALGGDPAPETETPDSGERPPESAAEAPDEPPSQPSAQA